jgi:hypothetical protein
MVSTKLNLVIKKTLTLPDGGTVVLIDMMGRTKSETWNDANRNVYRADTSGEVVWTIGTMSAPDEKFPYTNIYLDTEGHLKAYCWDGGEYAVNAETGVIDHGKLSK